MFRVFFYHNFKLRISINVILEHRLGGMICCYLLSPLGIKQVMKVKDVEVDGGGLWLLHFGN